MSSRNNLKLRPDEVLNEAETIVQAVGASHMGSVAYDTAWLARLAVTMGGNGFEVAFDWLRAHQFDDGSWGGDVLYFHDRYICTLAAAVALKEGGHHQDAVRVERAVRVLWDYQLRIGHPVETVAFPLLLASLTAEALSMGLDVPPYPLVDMEVIARKLSILKLSAASLGGDTLSHSIEAISSPFSGAEALIRADGSVSSSPSATVALLRRTKNTNGNSFNYLQRVMSVQGDGGMPNLHPFEAFEVVWVMETMRRLGVLDIGSPSMARWTEWLYKRWDGKRGVSFSESFVPTDLDVTAGAFVLLKEAGYPVDASVFAFFEEENHFRCYPREADLALAAHARVVVALRVAGMQDSDWMRKALAVLHRYEVIGKLWFDKWHLSPYYMVSVLVPCLAGVDDEIASAKVRWVQSTQRSDGGWGWYGKSTAEETAYAVQALLAWEQQGNILDDDNLIAAESFLLENKDDLVAQWVDKCLYLPVNIVRAGIISALYGLGVRNGGLQP